MRLCIFRHGHDIGHDAGIHQIAHRAESVPRRLPPHCIVDYSCWLFCRRPDDTHQNDSSTHVEHSFKRLHNKHAARVRHGGDHGGVHAASQDIGGTVVFTGFRAAGGAQYDILDPASANVG